MPTSKLDLPFVTTGASGQETVHNDALNLVDIYVFLAVEEFEASTEPGSPSNGTAYHLASSPSGSNWSGNGDKIAIYSGNAWSFVDPAKGWVLFDKNNDELRVAHAGGGGSIDWKIYGHQASDVGALTDNSGGSSSSTIGSVSGSGADSAINDNFASLASQINSLRTELRNAGVMA